MAQNQKDEIQNLSEEDDTPEIINYIKTQRIKKSSKYKKNSHNSKNKSTSINSTFYGTQKKNISNTSVNSSSHIKPSDKLSHNSLNSFNKSNKFSLIRTSYKTRGQLMNNRKSKSLNKRLLLLGSLQLCSKKTVGMTINTESAGKDKKYIILSMTASSGSV